MKKCKDCKEICDDRAIRCHSCANKILGQNQTGKNHPMYINGKSRTKKYQKEYNKKYREEHKETMKIKSKIYRTKNKDIKKEYDKQYRLKNKIKRQKLQRKYKQEHKKERKIYRDNKFKTDVGFKIEHNLRGRIHSALKGKNKSKSTMKLIGCSIENLKIHLENKFTKGMTWKNYGKGGWEIDHIRPCCSFNLINIKEQLKCFNYINLQPLWAEDNRRKHTKEI
jgi:hypothetical protein